MAEDLHGDPRRYALLQQQGRGGVPGVVQPCRPHLCVGQQGLPGAVVTPRVDGPPVGLAEDEVVVLPLRARRQALGQLGGPVRPEGVAEGTGQRECPAAGSRLGLDHDEPRARLTLQRLAHRQRASVEVDGVPGEAEGFALPQAEGEGHRPARAVAAAVGSVEDAPRFLRGQRPHLVVVDPWGVDQGADVARHPVALHGNLERPGQDPVGLQDRRRRQAAHEEVGVQLLDVFGLQPVQSMVPEAGDELVHDELAVADEGRRPHLARGDRVQPVLQPLGDGRDLAGGCRGAGVPFAL